MREQFFQRQRRQEFADQSCDPSFDVDAEAALEPVVAVDREDDECLADPLAQCAGVIALLTVQGRSPPVLLRQFERRIGLGKDVFGGDEEPVKVCRRDHPRNRKQGVDLRGDTPVTSGRPHRAVIEPKQARDVFFDRLVLPICYKRDNLAIRLRLGMPGTDQDHRHEGLCRVIIAGPYRRPDRGVLREAAPQDRRRTARLPCEPVDVAFLDSHDGERLLEGVVTEQVERNVGLNIDGVAGTENNAMTPAMGVDEFALGVFGMNNRDKRHGGFDKRPDRRRRCEDRRKVFEMAEFFVIKQAREKGERFVPRVGRDDEGPIARSVEPSLKRAPVRSNRGCEDFGG